MLNEDYSVAINIKTTPDEFDDREYTVTIGSDGLRMTDGVEVIYFSSAEQMQKVANALLQAVKISKISEDF